MTACPRKKHLFPLLALGWILAAQPVMAAPHALDRSSLGNMSYHGSWGESSYFVKLVNGSLFEAETGGGMYIFNIAWGDLDGDGDEDAALQLVESGGGSGSGVTLQVVINQQGKPQLFRDFIPLGDRTIVKSIAIQNRVIVLKLIVQGPKDGACCPSLHRKVKYRLQGDDLILVQP